MELVKQLTADQPKNDCISMHFHYEHKLKEIIPFKDGVELKMLSSDETICHKYDMVIKSIGLLTSPINGLPFEGGIIPNIDGRISYKNSVLPKLYVAGWAGVHSKGNIVVTRKDSDVSI